MHRSRRWKWNENLHNWNSKWLKNKLRFIKLRKRVNYWKINWVSTELQAVPVRLKSRNQRDHCVRSRLNVTRTRLTAEQNTRKSRLRSAVKNERIFPEINTVSRPSANEIRPRPEKNPIKKKKKKNVFKTTLPTRWSGFRLARTNIGS